jgi:hypothetical protein
MTGAAQDILILRAGAGTGVTVAAGLLDAGVLRNDGTRHQ